MIRLGTRVIYIEEYGSKLETRVIGRRGKNPIIEHPNGWLVYIRNKDSKLQDTYMKSINCPEYKDDATVRAWYASERDLIPALPKQRGKK